MADDARSRFTHDFDGTPAVQCWLCRHDRGGRRCDAFGPDTPIPEAIRRNQADHRRPFPGDHGIRFEAREGVDPDALATLAQHLDSPGNPPS